MAIPAPGPRPERTETGTDPSSSPTPAGSPTRSDQGPNRWFPPNEPAAECSCSRPHGLLLRVGRNQARRHL